jgi:hypothetical protein
MALTYWVQYRKTADDTYESSQAYCLRLRFNRDGIAVVDEGHNRACERRNGQEMQQVQRCNEELSSEKNSFFLSWAFICSDGSRMPEMRKIVSYQRILAEGRMADVEELLEDK